MDSSVPASKKRRIEKLNLFNEISKETIAFVFSFLDLLELIISICIVNKEFNDCIQNACTFLWRAYCQSHNINTTPWTVSAKHDIKSNINIQKLLDWHFPTVKENRYDIKSKYMNQIVNNGLIKINKINERYYEYDSIDLRNHSSVSKKVKCDNKEIHIIDSFVVHSFSGLRSLGNVEPTSRELDVWDGYKKRGDIFWQRFDANGIQTWLDEALLPGEYTYNLYCINNRNGRGKWSKTQQEKEEDKSYILSAQRFIKLFTDSFCMDQTHPYRFYCAGHIASEMLDLDRDEMIVAVNQVKMFAFYVYYSRCYG